MVPDPSLTIRERAIAAWPPAWHGQNLRDILVTLGYDVDTPWRELPKKDRDWILFTDEQPTVPVYRRLHAGGNARRAAPQDGAELHGHLHRRAQVRAAHLRDHAERADEEARRRASWSAAVCPVCDGKRLKREALSVTSRVDIGTLSQLIARSAAAARLLDCAPRG